MENEPILLVDFKYWQYGRKNLFFSCNHEFENDIIKKDT